VNKRFIASLVVIACVWLACEIAARHILPAVPGCAEVHRNPFRFRGYPEYMDGISNAPAASRIVLLSNSQAYAGEFQRAQIYATLLEEDLNQRKAGGRNDWRVCNWSVDGMTSMEYMLMAGRLREDPPAIVLAVIGYADFRGANETKGFSYCRSDIPRLCGRTDVARSLPFRFWLRHAKFEDLLTYGIVQRFALFRVREYLWSWLDIRYPGVQTVFYAPMVNYRFWQLTGRPRVQAVDLPAYRQEKVDFSYDERSTRMLREFLAQLAGLGTRTIIVNAPLRISTNDPRAAWNEPFRADLSALTGELGLPLWDLQAALPPEDFMTSSHFNRQNHQRFAKILADRLAAGTEPPP
jgi:hypothetical protein